MRIFDPIIDGNESWSPGHDAERHSGPSEMDRPPVGYGWHEGDHLARAAARAGFDLHAMDKVIETDPDRVEAVIAANEKDHAASGHWGVPTFVFDKEPFFGQDRIDLLTWRMESKGLTRRNDRSLPSWRPRDCC